ncbi:hypothetical protein ACFO26_00795 [Lactococcus nasutitermitis]|uniref:Cystathionine beta-lyase n=1 Tax=Lactococcus nasutitermitis TaxID=1652957 RepID=A0ABV9JAF4_9LACT|nr:hypothetical protein [Lactococcus nasutitermitis]
MANENWLDLALKYGGFMEQDKIFLNNRLENLENDVEKRLLVTPPASVLNAYFAELYQKRSAKDATDYYFELSKALNLFQEQPNFHLEGKIGTENFRFIRLNLSGKSFGFCYRNAQEEAIIFSEFPLKITMELLAEISQIFPDYALWIEDEQILMKPAQFSDDFERIESLSALTDRFENDKFIRLSGYNAQDLLENAEKIRYFGNLLLQYDKQYGLSLYISKAF